MIKESLSMSEEKLGQHYLAALNEAFPGVVLDHAWQTKDQLTVTVKVNYLPEVVEFLYYKQGGWLSVLFGNDERKLNGHYAVYYVLSMEKGTKCWITVRVEVDANKPEYPSVTPRVPAAVWGEREVRDMYGLIPVGLPDERRLVLPDDWPDELYPLRKDSMDYRQRPAPTTDAETYEFINELGDKKNNVVPIGPLHVTSDEPGHFRLFVDGENIIDADYRLFYVHRGMEKLAEEFSSDPEQVLPEAGPLESARAYREKKAKPLWAKIVKVLRSVYRAYCDLKSKFERLQADYGREVSKNSSLSERIYEVCAERDSLKGKVRDYERVRRAIGPEQADRILEAAYQQEQAEKERKRDARQKARLGAR